MVESNNETSHIIIIQTHSHCNTRNGISQVFKQDKSRIKKSRFAIAPVKGNQRYAEQNDDHAKALQETFGLSYYSIQ